MKPGPGRKDAAAAHHWIGELLSEPLTVVALTKPFCFHRNTMCKVLLSYERQGLAERCGRFWRVRLAKMPPRYWIEQGLWQRSDAA